LELGDATPYERNLGLSSDCNAAIIDLAAESFGLLVCLAGAVSASKPVGRALAEGSSTKVRGAIIAVAASSSSADDIAIALQDIIRLGLLDFGAGGLISAINDGVKWYEWALIGVGIIAEATALFFSGGASLALKIFAKTLSLTTFGLALAGVIEDCEGESSSGSGSGLLRGHMESCDATVADACQPPLLCSPYYGVCIGESTLGMGCVASLHEYCRPDLNLECDSSTNTCVLPIGTKGDYCNENRFCDPWSICELSICQGIRDIGETCRDSFGLYCGLGLECHNGECRCQETGGCPSPQGGYCNDSENRFCDSGLNCELGICQGTQGIDAVCGASFRWYCGPGLECHNGECRCQETGGCPGTKGDYCNDSEDRLCDRGLNCELDICQGTQDIGAV
jgi:hypothetical protein